MKLEKQFVTHLGGVVTMTKTGLIHKAGKAYSGEATDEGQDFLAPADQPKAKRGRPAKKK